jgi:hypothetical protein
VIVITLKASLSLGNQEDQCHWGPCSLLQTHAIHCISQVCQLGTFTCLFI